MKILVVMPNDTIYPVGIAYITASLKKAGHLVDGIIFNNYDTLVEKLRNNYDFIATGGLSSEYIKLKHISNIAKQVNTKIIIGGGIITSEPELMSKALNVDYSIIGEGEETIIELISCIEKNENLSNVKGICYFDKGELKITENRNQIEDLDSIPWPDFDAFNYSKHLDSMKPTDLYYYDIFDYPREYPLVASRSCPFLCTFCFHPTGNRYRQRSIDSIMNELKEMIPKYKINIVSIYDELFSYSEERCYEFSKRFKEFTETLSWEVKWGCQMRVSDINVEMLDAMKASGCFLVSYGFESYSKKVLKSMKKAIQPEQIHNAIHKTLDRGISIQGNFIFGDKAETLESAMDTLEFWKEHTEAGIQIYNVMACPKSEIYQYCINNNIISDKLNYIKYHLFDALNMTEMSKRDFSKLLDLIYIYQLKYNVCVTPAKINPDSIVVRCPHCEEIIQYNNFTIKGLFYKRVMYCRNCRKRFYIVSAVFALYSKYDQVALCVYKIKTKLDKIRSTLFTMLKSSSFIYRTYKNMYGYFHR